MGEKIEILADYIPRSKWTRPGKVRSCTQGIVVHWFGNAGQSAKGCRNFFANRSEGYGSAQYIIGLQGEIIQTMPMDEIAYHCGSDTLDPASKKIYTDLAREAFGPYASYPEKLSPNAVTVGIECAHLDNRGTMTKETLASLKNLVEYLCSFYHLQTSRVFTHHDIVGWKDCPRWFVENPEEWKKFKGALLV